MKKSVIWIVIAVVALVAAMLLGYQGLSRAQNTPAERPQFGEIKLLQPDLSGGATVMQALKNRKSTRSFLDKPLSLQHLSDLLWAANGVNREDGKRTAPAALGIQFVDIYVVLKEGVYLYDAPKNELVLVAAGDFRAETGMQHFVSTAPLNLVYVADLAKLKRLPEFVPVMSREAKLGWAYVAAGAQSENVYLYCASAGLGAVVRALIDRGKFGQTARLRPEQVIVLTQTVGYPG